MGLNWSDNMQIMLAKGRKWDKKSRTKPVSRDKLVFVWEQHDGCQHFPCTVVSTLSTKMCAMWNEVSESNKVWKMSFITVLEDNVHCVNVTNCRPFWKCAIESRKKRRKKKGRNMVYRSSGCTKQLQKIIAGTAALFSYWKLMHEGSKEEDTFEPLHCTTVILSQILLSLHSTSKIRFDS